MSQQQTQSQSSQAQSSQAQSSPTQASQSQSQTQSRAAAPRETEAQDASLGTPAAPDPTSPYSGPAQAEIPHKRPQQVADDEGPSDMAHPHFSEAQSTLAATSPISRPGDRFGEPEDPLPHDATARPADQPAAASPRAVEFATESGTVRQGMTVVDGQGRAIGTVANIDGERMRLASADPHDDGVSFLPVSLIDGVDGDRVLLSGRGDASFGMPTD